MEEDFSALETALEVANDVFGVKYGKDYKKLVDAKAYAGKHYAIDDRVEIICDGAFKDCDNLEEIVMPKNLKNIGDEAFYGCSGLSELTLPNSLTKIGNGAFHYCLIILSLLLNLPIILYVSLAELSSLLRLYEMEYSPDFVSPFTNFIDPAKGINFS